MKTTKTRIVLDKKDYYNYINSYAWQAMRRRFWSSKLPKHCYCCGKSDIALELHHKTYKRLGHENLNDLILVCRNCHGNIHKLYEMRIKKCINEGTINPGLWVMARKYRKKLERKQN